MIMHFIKATPKITNNGDNERISDPSTASLGWQNALKTVSSINIFCLGVDELFSVVQNQLSYEPDFTSLLFYEINIKYQKYLLAW